MSETNTIPGVNSRRRRLARKLAVDLSIMTVIGVVLALIGPFGSFETALPVRLVNWLGFSYLGYAIYSPMGAVVEWVHKALDLSKAWLWVAAVLVATIPMTAAIWSIGHLPAPIATPSLEAGLISYFYVLVIGGGVTALFQVIESRKNLEGQVVGSPASVEGPPATDMTAEAAVEIEQVGSRFLERLPPALGSDLIALEMEDHYVRAHTPLGSELILLRMRDAIAELEGVEGAQVHRSWWVARSAVEKSRRDGRNLRLVLKAGLEAPVSRSAAPMLKEAGWF